MLSKGRIPNGCKPCSVPFETTLWDSISPEENLRTFGLEIPDGKSLRECREILQRAYLERMKRYDLLVAQQQREVLRAATKKVLLFPHACRHVLSSLLFGMNLTLI